MQSESVSGIDIGIHQRPIFAGSSKKITNFCANCLSSDPGGTWRRNPVTGENLCNSCGLKLSRKRRKEESSDPDSIPVKTARTNSTASAPGAPSSFNNQLLPLYFLLGQAILKQVQGSSVSDSLAQDPLPHETLPDPFSTPLSQAVRPPLEREAAVRPGPFTNDRNDTVPRSSDGRQSGEAEAPAQIEGKSSSCSLMLSSSSYGSLFDLLLSKSIDLDLSV